MFTGYVPFYLVQLVSFFDGLYAWLDCVSIDNTLTTSHDFNCINSRICIGNMTSSYIQVHSDWGFFPSSSVLNASFSFVAIVSIV